MEKTRVSPALSYEKGGIKSAVQQPIHLLRDAAIITLSIFITFNFVKIGAISDILLRSELVVISSILAGGFFISVFTVAPATVVLIELMRSTNPFLVAFFAGFGAVLGDLLIFTFVKDALAEDIFYIMRKAGFGSIKNRFQNKHLRFILAAVGALIVASPLPDEVGLVLMGLSQMKKIKFILLSFALNFLGILTFGLFVRNI